MVNEEPDVHHVHPLRLYWALKHSGYSYALLAISQLTDCQQEHERPGKQKLRIQLKSLLHNPCNTYRTPNVKNVSVKDKDPKKKIDPLCNQILNVCKSSHREVKMPHK